MVLAAASPRKNRQALQLTSQLPEVARHYQAVLAENPRQPQALLGMSLVALASRQTDAAISLALAAIAVAPQTGAAWVTLGQALRAAQRWDEAGQAYATAIGIDGADPLAHMGMGELKLATSRAQEAMQEFELALWREPALVAAHLGCGHALVCLGHYEPGLVRYEKALSLRPRLAEGEFAAAYALSRLGRPRQAEIRYRRALHYRPDFAPAWMNLGCLLREQGDDVRAELALKRALTLRPEKVCGWINLAALERTRGRLATAQAYLRKAFALNPDQVETQIAWAQFCSAQNDFAGARGWLRWALCRECGNEEAHNTMGILLHGEGRFAEAVTAFEAAEALGSKAATSNRGNSLLDMGRMDEALAAHRSAVGRDPNHPGAQYNLALTQLRLGDWQQGWATYESRWRFREVHRKPRTFNRPRWRGEQLSGQRILLHAEQGLGDTIQFCRYAALVAARDGFPILQVQAPVVRLMRSLALVRSGQALVTQLGEPSPTFDLECPLMSLPAVFGTMVDTVPWTGPYLASNHEEAASKLVRFSGSQPEGLRIGVAWAGNARYKADKQRSVELPTLLPLLRLPGITWISLQKGDPAGQIAALPRGVFVLDGCSADQDLAETAAMTATLDLVITTDTSIAHLAGAIGKPVWIMLPHLSDWRWMQDVETTPWYPTARLFRQPVPGDWGNVLNRITEELRLGWTLDRPEVLSAPAS